MDGCQTINRTDYQKYTTYTGDGMGRDSYAVVGNGGLIKPHAFKNIAPATGYNHKYIGSAFTMKAPPAKIVGKKNETAQRYWGSGAGRETYIINDSGGGIPPYGSKSPLAQYYDSLRHYPEAGNRYVDTLKLNVQTPHHMTAGGRQVYNSVSPQYPMRYRHMWRKQANDQQEQSLRLSVPKSIRQSLDDCQYQTDNTISNKVRRSRQNSKSLNKTMSTVKVTDILSASAEHSPDYQEPRQRPGTDCAVRTTVNTQETIEMLDDIPDLPIGGVGLTFDDGQLQERLKNKIISRQVPNLQGTLSTSAVKKNESIEAPSPVQQHTGFKFSRPHTTTGHSKNKSMYDSRIFKVKQTPVRKTPENMSIDQEIQLTGPEYQDIDFKPQPKKLLRLLTGNSKSRTQRVQLMASVIQDQAKTKDDKDLELRGAELRTPFTVMKKQRPKSRQVAMSIDKHNFGMMPTTLSDSIEVGKKEGVTPKTTKMTNDQLIKNYLNSSQEMPSTLDRTAGAGQPSSFPTAHPTSKTRLSFNAKHSLIHSYFDDDKFKIQTPIRATSHLHRRHLTASVDSEAGRSTPKQGAAIRMRQAPKTTTGIEYIQDAEEVANLLQHANIDISLAKDDTLEVSGKKALPVQMSKSQRRNLQQLITEIKQKKQFEKEQRQNSAFRTNSHMNKTGPQHNQDNNNNNRGQQRNVAFSAFKTEQNV